MNTDPIADYLTRIRNANEARLKTVEIPGSKIKLELTKILLDPVSYTHLTLPTIE